MQNRYSAALEEEKRIYRDRLFVHDLPPIFHYWSTRHVAPLVRRFGFDSPDDLFSRTLEEACSISAEPRFASIGCGNCDLEVALALDLIRKGYREFSMECIDINASMLDRGRAAARDAGVDARLIFTEADLNRWRPAGRYHAVIANQSLHHIVNLEELFAAVRSSLERGGAFAVSDMIGRNGHLRWPEALAIVYEFWVELPPAYRLNTRLERYEETFEDSDSSGEGFEGVRAQDILPLLDSMFQFRLFVPFGNVIDVFVDRAFGFHFDPSIPWDRDFIDRVHARDLREIEAGRITPTHMLAVLSNEHDRAPRWPGRLSPSFCLRPQERVMQQPVPPREPFASANRETAAWREAGRMLNQARRRAIDLDRQLHERTAWALEMERGLAGRTAWALDLEREHGALRHHAQSLEQLWRDRTRWALDLQSELERAEGIARHFETEAAREAARADRLEADLSRRARNPALWFARKFVRGLRRC